MKLAVIIVILAFCYCGSAIADRCICRQPEEMVPDPEDLDDTSIQTRTRRDEEAQELLEDPDSKRKILFKFGAGSKVTPRRRRGLLDPEFLRILQELFKGKSLKNSLKIGDYESQG